MPLSKEKMREYQRERRRALKDSVLAEKESVVETPLGDSDVVAPEPEVEKPDIQITHTDRLFEISRPGYWIYDKEVKKRECIECGRVFTTRLELNKFCSPKCKKARLANFTTVGLKIE